MPDIAPIYRFVDPVVMALSDGVLLQLEPLVKQLSLELKVTYRPNRVIIDAPMRVDYYKHPMVHVLSSPPPPSGDVYSVTISVTAAGVDVYDSHESGDILDNPPNTVFIRLANFEDPKFFEQVCAAAKIRMEAQCHKTT